MRTLNRTLGLVTLLGVIGAGALISGCATSREYQQEKSYREILIESGVIKESERPYADRVLHYNQKKTLKSDN